MPLEDAVRTFKALSDPTRLRIVLLLSERDLCVCELMYVLKMEQSRLSHQLRILREAGLVEDVRKGRWMIYRIGDSARPGLKTVLDAILREDGGRAADVLRDVERLDLCLKEKVRFRRPVGTGAGGTTGGAIKEERHGR